jgi:hypothetical protein
MASGPVLAHYRQLYGRADKALQQWDTLHVGSHVNTLRTLVCMP